MMTDRYRRVRYLLPLVVMLVIASIQIARVHLYGQTRWRGGGFGMYTELHPNHTEIWVYRGDKPRQLDRAHIPFAPQPPLASCKDPDERLRELRALPTKASLDAFWVDCLPDPTITRVELWRRRFDIERWAMVRSRVRSSEHAASRSAGDSQREEDAP